MPAAPVSRSARIGLLLVVLLLGGGGAWWLLRPEPPYPRADRVGGLTDSVTVRWAASGLAAVDADDPLDALTALGYVHGITRGWTVALWRQTALGRLSRWFGEGVLPIDRHARRLTLARQARQAYERLPAAQKRPLQAYSRGLNDALQSDRVRQQDAFVLHDVTPGPWRPWHTLAVERLLAWLATPPIEPPAAAPSGVTDFHEQDRRLRRWLHLHGWGRSVAWAVRSPSGGTRSTLFQRHVLGALATPVLQEVQLRLPDRPTIAAATWPGVPLLATGHRGTVAWTSLLRSPARIQQTALDSTRLRRRHERLTPAGGDEQLVEVEQLGGGLLLGTSPPSARTRPGGPDTTRTRPIAPTAWALRWPGFSSATDLPAWLRRAGLAPTGIDTTAFRLFAADGLRVTSKKDWTVLGSPPVVVRDSAGRYVMVGRSSWARHQARSLERRPHAASVPPGDNGGIRDSSTWAARTLPGMAAALDRLAATHPSFRNVATYLRNWDYTYTPTSLGATLFDQWMRAYRADLGHVPTPADTAAYFATYREHRALLRALDTLRTRYGPDVRRWRWERVVPDRRYFPVWSADSLVDADLSDLRTTRYAPLERSGRGHPSTLTGGPSLVAPPPTAPAPTTWEGWVRPGEDAFTVRRYRYDPTAVFARSRMRRGRPPPARLVADSARYTKRLRPARP